MNRFKRFDELVTSSKKRQGFHCKVLFWFTWVGVAIYVASFSNTKKTPLGNVLVNICPNEKKFV